MDSKEIRKWVENNAEGQLLDYDHIAMCLEHIQRWYYEGYPLGHFLTAVVRNDLCEACFRADDINVRALKLYALFLSNHLPYDWREKANPKIKESK